MLNDEKYSAFYAIVEKIHIFVQSNIFFIDEITFADKIGASTNYLHGSENNYLRHRGR